jgi:hypothetical protein
MKKAGTDFLGSFAVPAIVSRRRLDDGDSVRDVNTPALFMHAAVMRTAQGHQVRELGRPAVRPVDDVVPVNPQM